MKAIFFDILLLIVTSSLIYIVIDKISVRKKITTITFLNNNGKLVVDFTYIASINYKNENETLEFIHINGYLWKFSGISKESADDIIQKYLKYHSTIIRILI